MAAGGGEIRADDQQLGSRDLAGSQLIAQLVDEMLRRVQVLDGGDAEGKHALAEDLRDLLAQENIAFLLVMAAESPLDMEVRVDEPRHEGVPAPVDGGRSGIVDRLAADLLDDSILYQDVLMEQLAAVADDDMDVFDQIPVRRFPFRPA